MPRQQPASRQTQGQRQDYDGQNGSHDRATGHANTAVPSRGAASRRPLSGPRSICQRSAAPPLAPSHSGKEVGVVRAPGGGKGARGLPRLLGSSAARGSHRFFSSNSLPRPSALLPPLAGSPAPLRQVKTPSSEPLSRVWHRASHWVGSAFTGLAFIWCPHGVYRLVEKKKRNQSHTALF